MEPSRRQHAVLSALLFAAFAALLLVGLGGFGIWDPWELNAADAARDLLDGEGGASRPPLRRWLIAQSFSALGVSEWSGRLPVVFGGLLTLFAAWFGALRFAGRRAALFATVIAGTTPLFLFNARQMLGEAWAMGASGLLGVVAASTAFRGSLADEANLRKRSAALHLLGLFAALALAILAGGALAAAAPPLAAVAVVILLRRQVPADPEQRLRVGLVLVVGLAVVGMVAQAIVADAAGYSMWLGGAPRGGDPPTFEAALEVVFHSFAPWSALVLLACARMLAPPRPDPAQLAADDESDGKIVHEDPDADAPAIPFDARADFRLMIVLWAAFGYAALNLYTARYGPATFVAVVPVAIAVGLFLRDVETSKRTWWAEAVIGALFVGLLVRDFALYPESPVRGLPIEGLAVPEVFEARKPWAAVLALFAGAMLLAMGTAPKGDRPDLRAPYRWIKARYRRDRAGKIWVGLAAVLLAGMLIFGAIAWIGGESLPLTSIVVRVGRKLLFVPIALPIVVALVPWTGTFARRIGHWRMVPLLLAGLVCGGYASAAFLPSLSSHFSPREVYDTYNELAGEGEPLAEYGVNGRAAAYYAEGETEDLDTQAELQQWLGRSERVWAVIPADDLAAVNRAFRQRHERHVYVADARSARVLLLTNQDVAGRENQNFIAGAVLDEAPRVEHRSGGRFGDKIELIGYDLELPQNGYVGAGQAFTVTWYWRALQRVGGNYKIFLHVDGHGNRLNGDHEPVDERYPVRLWDEGDIVVDRQTLRVPANYRPGHYTFWIGFYSGNNRLAVTPEDKNDGADRLNAGTLIIR